MDGIDYVYSTPNRLEHDNQNNLEHCDTCQPLWWPEPSEMITMPLPYPDHSEASERSSSLLTSLLSLPKKDDIEPIASSMYMESPNVSWSLCLAPTKKYGRAEPEEESEMREGTGLRKGGPSPDREFGRGIGTGVA